VKKITGNSLAVIFFDAYSGTSMYIFNITTGVRKNIFIVQLKTEKEQNRYEPDNRNSNENEKRAFMYDILISF